MAACDFFTAEVCTPSRLVTFYVLFVIEIATRRVEIAGITVAPDSAWMKQVARNLTKLRRLARVYTPVSCKRT
jgi:putative transposase